MSDSSVERLKVSGLKLRRPLEVKGGVGEVAGLPAAAAIEVMGFEESESSPMARSKATMASSG